MEEEGRGGHEVKITRKEQRVKRGEEGWNSPSQAGRMCGKQMPPTLCLLLPLVPRNSFLSLLYPFAVRYRELSGLCPVCRSGVRLENTALADTYLPYLPRVVN